MPNINDTVFPMTMEAFQLQAQIGLTKREYFAAIALQGLLTKYTLNNPEDQQIICKMAAELSNELINSLNENL
jgi:hypothetical protein